MNMKDRFWTRLGKTCSILVVIWICFIKLFNRSKILKAVDIDTSEEDLNSLLEEEYWKSWYRREFNTSKFYLFDFLDLK